MKYDEVYTQILTTALEAHLKPWLLVTLRLWANPLANTSWAWFEGEDPGHLIHVGKNL